MNKRYIELDLLRTIAIAMMVLYHAAYDLDVFYGWNLETLNGGWWIFSRLTAVLFLLIVGVSFAISWDRHHPRTYRKYFLRGLFVIACGMLVTFVTFLWDPGNYVRFGILHLIGTSILLLPLFARLRVINGALGIMIIAAHFLINNSPLQTSLLLPLGIMPLHFNSIDYFPLIPWFGFVLIGYALGHVIYVRHVRRTPSARGQERPLWITWPSRHALLIYMLHQPTILGFFVCLDSLDFL